MNPIPVSSLRPTMIIASTSAIKVGAVRDVFGRYQVDLFKVHTDSGVNAQPVNGETYTGALNRISDVQKKFRASRMSQDHWVIAIENGIFSERINGQAVWVDRAVVIVQSPTGMQYRADSAPVIFPGKFVDTAKARGFDKTTVGQVMAEATAVKSGNDPHASLPPFCSRRTHLEKSLNMIATVLEQTRLITPVTFQPVKALKA